MGAGGPKAGLHNPHSHHMHRSPEGGTHKLNQTSHFGELRP